MQAISVAGGPGSRLRPLTDFRPKHVLPVGGVPFLAHQLARLAAAGVEQVALAVSYRAGDIVDVLGDGSAGSDPVVVLNGDVLPDHDIAAQVAHFEGAAADVSLHVVGVADARAYGSVPTDASGRVSAFEEKSARPVSSQINAGCYVFRRSVIEQIPANAVVSVERETFPGLLAAGASSLGTAATATGWTWEPRRRWCTPRATSCAASSARRP
jgi:mannose-1-phosphate guanylyltransferase